MYFFSKDFFNRFFENKRFFVPGFREVLREVLVFDAHERCCAFVVDTPLGHDTGGSVDQQEADMLAVCRQHTSASLRR